MIGLLRVIEHFISKELLKNQKGQQAANHCLRSLLESMVDLKELVESPDTSSDTSDTSESGSGSESGGDGSIDVSCNSQRRMTVLNLLFHKVHDTSIVRKGMQASFLCT